MRSSINTTLHTYGVSINREYDMDDVYQKYATDTSSVDTKSKNKISSSITKSNSSSQPMLKNDRVLEKMQELQGVLDKYMLPNKNVAGYKKLSKGVEYTKRQQPYSTYANQYNNNNMEKLTYIQEDQEYHNNTNGSIYTQEGQKNVKNTAIYKSIYTQSPTNKPTMKEFFGGVKNKIRQIDRDGSIVDDNAIDAANVYIQSPSSDTSLSSKYNDIMDIILPKLNTRSSVSEETKRVLMLYVLYLINERYHKCTQWFSNNENAIKKYIRNSRDTRDRSVIDSVNDAVNKMNGYINDIFGKIQPEINSASGSEILETLRRIHKEYEFIIDSVFQQISDTVMSATDTYKPFSSEIYEICKRELQEMVSKYSQDQTTNSSELYGEHD